MANYIKQLKDNDGNNIYPLAYNNGGMKMDLLWTNPSPTSSFAAQTIALDLSDYHLYLILSIDYVSSSLSSNYLNTLIMFPLTKSRMFYVTDSPTTNRTTAFRNIELANNSIVFAAGTTGNSATDNNICVPYQIYGIKLSYIVPTSVHGLQYVEVEE